MWQRALPSFISHPPHDPVEQPCNKMDAKWLLRARVKKPEPHLVRNGRLLTGA